MGSVVISLHAISGRRLNRSCRYNLGRPLLAHIKLTVYVFQTDRELEPCSSGTDGMVLKLVNLLQTR